ncbi:hypothetical protein GCM10012282_80960 [Streptomyces lacrimifluminis]|uniref:Uncharacterized protein n=1 Tax=Streptomyces lacrimifluminis TaxID=1500077 RepID=A0A917PDG5_9ACTN|nr:hypothetical protein GCM10012282_80960 [Streptomyces lacrimifluminis]
MGQCVADHLGHGVTLLVVDLRQKAEHTIGNAHLGRRTARSSAGAPMTGGNKPARISATAHRTGPDDHCLDRHRFCLRSTVALIVAGCFTAWFVLALIVVHIRGGRGGEALGRAYVATFWWGDYISP